MIDHFLERIVDKMRKNQYQPAKDRQMTDAQEVHYAKKFKWADIAGGFHKPARKRKES